MPTAPDKLMVRDTPRADAVVKLVALMDDNDAYAEMRKLARTLERENAEMREALQIFADRSSWANLRFKGTSGEGATIKAIGWAHSKEHPADIAASALAPHAKAGGA